MREFYTQEENVRSYKVLYLKYILTEALYIVTFFLLV